MLNFHEYRILHFFSLFLFVALWAVDLYAPGISKIRRMVMMVSSLVVLVSGFGMLARLGVMTSSDWPLWSYLKMGLWVLITFGGMILSKRAKSFRNIVFPLIMFLILTAIIAIVTKPN